MSARPANTASATGEAGVRLAGREGGRLHVGSVLRREREAAGFTSAEVGLYIGCTEKTVTAYESAHRPQRRAVRLILTHCRSSPWLIRRVARLYTVTGRAAK